MSDESSRISRRSFLATTAAVGACGVSGPLRAQPKPIRIGLLYPVTGFLAYSAAQLRLGATMAIDEINAAGGIRSLGGAKLEGVIADTQAKPEVAVGLVERLHEEGVTAFVGAMTSSIALAATQAAAKYNVPFMIDSGVSDLIVSRGLKNVFRLMPGFGSIIDDGVAGLGEVNKAHGNIAKSAVLVHEESEFGTGTAKQVAAKLPSIGIEVKESIKHANPTRDFSNVALRIRSLKPDLVIMTNYQNEFVLMARTLYQQRIDVAAMYSIFGGGFNYKLVKETPDIAQYMMDFNQWFDPTHPKAQAMKARLEKKGDLMTFEVYCAYNGIKCLADAMERARSADKEKLVAALESSTWSDHFMPYGPTRFVNGQNTGAKGVMLQASRSDIDVVWPNRYASAKPVFPKPKFS